MGYSTREGRPNGPTEEAGDRLTARLYAPPNPAGV